MIRAERKRTELGSPLRYISTGSPMGEKPKKEEKKVSRLDTVQHKRVRDIMLQKFLTK